MQTTQNSISHPDTSPLILVADDNELMQCLMGDILETGGVQVVFANDAREAIARIRQLGHQLSGAVVDALMPYGGGRGVLNFLRDEAIELPVILASGSYDDVTDLVKEFPGVYALEKPFHADDLLVHVKHLARKVA